MNNFKNTPASMRYLGARLKPFRRPMFWGSLGLASLIGLTIYQYWRHPDWLNANLTELEANKTNSVSKLSNLANQEQLSAEDLAIGAEIDNLDLLLEELEQNQAIPLNIPINSQKAKQSLKGDSRDTIYRRFQEQQKAKLNQAPAPLIPTKTSNNNLVTSPTRNLFQFPGFSSYNSLVPINSNQQNSTSSQPELIPNPIGRLYLSDRDRNRQQNQATIRQNINTNSSSFNQFSPVNSNPTGTENTGTNLSSPANPSSSTAPIRVNTGEIDNSVAPSPIPYNNNLNAVPLTPRPAFYGQPIYQQPANRNNVNTDFVGNIPTNIAPTGLPSGNLTNQQQTQRYYQLTPSNYQLQPQGYNPPNPTNQNSNFNFASPSNNFPSNESFNSSQFDNTRTPRLREF